MQREQNACQFITIRAPVKDSPPPFVLFTIPLENESKKKIPHFELSQKMVAWGSQKDSFYFARISSRKNKVGQMAKNKSTVVITLP